MINLINYFLLFFIKTLNKIGRGFHLKKRILSTKRILKKNFKTGLKFSFVQV